MFPKPITGAARGASSKSLTVPTLQANQLTVQVEEPLRRNPSVHSSRSNRSVMSAAKSSVAGTEVAPQDEHDGMEVFVDGHGNVIHRKGSRPLVRTNTKWDNPRNSISQDPTKSVEDNKAFFFDIPSPKSGKPEGSTIYPGPGYDQVLSDTLPRRPVSPASPMRPPPSPVPNTMMTDQSEAPRLPPSHPWAVSQRRLSEEAMQEQAMRQAQRTSSSSLMLKPKMPSRPPPSSHGGSQTSLQATAGRLAKSASNQSVIPPTAADPLVSEEGEEK